jgi:branched-subunit amino acid aminotransferase/4-amino-4-deoxychorismate lyase
LVFLWHNLELDILEERRYTMAGFEGVKWASHQMRYLLNGRKFEIVEANAKVFAVSRSIHYGLFLVFEGIRFFCKENDKGELEAVFLNWDKNLERFKKGIAFNLSSNQQHLVPDVDELEELFIQKYFKHPSMHDFFIGMARKKAQGYLRPYTVDEKQSIGVTFPEDPSIRAVVCSYDRYLGEPFSGVAVPNLVRVMGINRTGCLKLGVNYLMSVKAVDAARKIHPGAAAALFLDDRVHDKLEDRVITEWDSSCCLFAFRDGTVVKIPESPLILPSVTIIGAVAILRKMGIPIVERNISYGELILKASNDELVAACSIGTAGILNRCKELILVNGEDEILVTHHPDENHDLYKILGNVRTHYWDIYQGKEAAPEGLKLFRYVLLETSEIK